MSLDPFLMPGENVRFRSKTNVLKGDRKYQVIITDMRLILFARRGLVFKSNDLVTERIDLIQGINYEEKGVIQKKGRVVIRGETNMAFEGDISEIKELYHILLPFLSRKSATTGALEPSPQTETMYCPTCSKLAVYIPQFQRYYCYNCKKYVELPPPP